MLVYRTRLPLMTSRPRFPVGLLVAALTFACPLSTMAQQASAPGSDAQALSREAEILKSQGNLDGALAKASSAVQSDPNDFKAYILRGDIYSRKKSWKEAEQDFNAALKLAPDNVLARFDLAEIKLMQKQYEAARPGFLALTKDPDFGDLAAYKVYLCDLFGQNQFAATKELSAFNESGRHASYYYANAARRLYLGETEEAREWIQAGVKIYPPDKTIAYLSTLKDFGYLPLPPTPEKP